MMFTTRSFFHASHLGKLVGKSAKNMGVHSRLFETMQTSLVLRMFSQVPSMTVSGSGFMHRMTITCSNGLTKLPWIIFIGRPIARVRSTFGVVEQSTTDSLIQMCPGQIGGVHIHVVRCANLEEIKCPCEHILSQPQRHHQLQPRWQRQQHHQLQPRWQRRVENRVVRGKRSMEDRVVNALSEPSRVLMTPSHVHYARLENLHLPLDAIRASHVWLDTMGIRLVLIPVKHALRVFITKRSGNQNAMHVLRESIRIRRLPPFVTTVPLVHTPAIWVRHRVIYVPRDITRRSPAANHATRVPSINSHTSKAKLNVDSAHLGLYHWILGLPDVSQLPQVQQFSQ